MNVGTELYGKTEDLEPASPLKVNKKRDVTHEDTKTGVEYTFMDDRLN